MGDVKYYPDRWKEYVSTLKERGSLPSREWGTFAARYRVAGNYAGVTFFSMSRSVVNGYDRGIQLLLSYSAFESACTASGVDPTERPISSHEGIAKTARMGLIKAFGQTPESAFPLRSALTSRKLASKIDAFFSGQDNSLQPVAAAIRHLFAHGVWTPHGSKMLTVTACNALNLLAQSVLREGDRILDDEVSRICDKK